MSTRKFVTIVLVALVIWVIALIPMAFACAENNAYEVDAVVVNFSASFDCVKVEVFDEEGNIWAYFVTDEEVHIGDVVTLTVFDYGDEKNEIIDAVCVGHLDTVDMIQWILR